MEGSVFGWFDPAANRLKILTGTYCYYPVNQWCFKVRAMILSMSSNERHSYGTTLCSIKARQSINVYFLRMESPGSRLQVRFLAHLHQVLSFLPANGSLFLYEASNITFVSGCYMLTCSLKEVPSFVLLFLAFRLAVASQSSVRPCSRYVFSYNSFSLCF